MRDPNKLEGMVQKSVTTSDTDEGPDVDGKMATTTGERIMSAPERKGGRSNDCGIGRPDRTSHSIRKVKELPPINEAKPPPKIEDVLVDIQLGESMLTQGPVSRLVIAVIIACISLFVGSHALSIWAQILLLPVPLQWFVGILTGGLVSFIAYSLCGSMRLFWKLRSDRQLTLAGFRQVKATRSNERQLLHKIKRECLLPYLSEFIDRFEDSKNADYPRIQELFQQQKGENEILRNARKLLAETPNMSDKDWFSRFLSDVHEPLEVLSKDKVNEYAKVVALKTALSPWPLVDTVSAIYNASEMARDLMLIYNRSFGRIDRLRFLMHLFFTIYIAGEAQEAIDTVKDVETDGIFSAQVGSESSGENVAGETGGELATHLAGGLAGSLLKASLGKFAEGGTNWLMMRRLGRRMIEMLRPIREGAELLSR